MSGVSEWVCGDCGSPVDAEGIEVTMHCDRHRPVRSASPYPPLLGLGAVVAGEGGSPELYRRQRHALSAATDAAARIDDAPHVVARAAVDAYLKSMRLSEEGR